MRRSAAGVALSAGLLGAALLAGCGGSSGSGSDVPTGAVAVVDGQNITVAAARDHDEHRQALAQDVAIRSRAPSEWVSLRTRALESLAHDAELRAWAQEPRRDGQAERRRRGRQGKTLSNAFPGKTAGTIDQAKVDAEFKSTGMTRELFRSRTETKLLAQAAANKVGKVARRHGRAGQGSLREGQGRPRTRCRSAASCATSWSRTRRSPTSCMRSSSPRTRNSPSSRSSTRPTPPARRPAASSVRPARPISSSRSPTSPSRSARASSRSR